MKSPYQLFNGQEPEIQYLKIFGTIVYPFMRPYNENKLQPRITQCVFLGYVMSYMGVSCYNISFGKLVISRHVVHDEEVFPYRIKQSSASQQCTSSHQQNSRPIMIQLPRAITSSSSTHQDREYVSYRD